MGLRILSDEDVTEIKARIWKGELYGTISLTFSVSEQYISLISRGKRYFDAEWPDGSTGPLPMHRVREIHRARYPNILSGAAQQIESATQQEDFKDRIDAAEQDSAVAADWTECQKVIAEDKQLVKDAKRNPKVKAAIQNILAQLPRSQWSVKNIRQVLPSLLDGM